MRKLRRKRAAVVAVIVALAAAGSAAAALQQLPAGGQVNASDPAAGIDQTKGVDGGEPTNADVVGGAIVANAPAVPWATFRAHETPSKDQIFVRSFIKTGVWKTQGNGTVGGKSSASPTFPGSLNFDQGQDGEVPAIDFAGTSRIVPWASWYEDTTAFGGKKQIFASRFDKTTGNWIFGGQGRGFDGVIPVPSLNIRTNQDAENPSVAGGSAVDPTKPGPWVTWQETTSLPVAGKDQIFVSRPLGPGQAANSCDIGSVLPAGVNDGTSHVPIDGGFCWQQTGAQRVGPTAADPSLNIDPTRNGIEPDIAFTGSNDHVPWVVWYEKDAGTLGLHTNEMVFAAKGLAVPSPTVGNGGFNWTAVGQTGSGLLDTSGATHHFGACAESLAAEEGCSLNKNFANDAEDPRVAAGTMNPLNPTVPWAVWDETVAGVKQVFVSRLVGNNFQIANNGAPISLGANDSTRPDITFSGNTPYVSWREDEGGVTKLFVGHFINAANPTFVLDSNTTTIAPTGTGAGQADVRSPISSGCIADPFNQDGANCTGSAIGTPFFLFTTATGSLLNLLGDAYQPGTPVTNAGATGITQSSGVVTGSVDPQGASVATSFNYGLTTAYERGSVPASPAKTGTDGASAFSAALTGLPAGTTVHFQAVVTSDFGTFKGSDQTFTTTAVPPPPTDGHPHIGHASVSGNTASVKASCTGAAGSKCKLSFRLTITETLIGRRVIAISSRAHKHKVVVTMGSASTTLNAGQSKTVKISLNTTGKRLVTVLRKLKTTLTVTQTLLNGHRRTVNTQKVTFRAPPRKHHHHH